MIAVTIYAVCSNGHRQVIMAGYADSFDEQNFAARLASSASLYLAKPCPETVIGTCESCGGYVRCEFAPGDPHV